MRGSPPSISSRWKDTYRQAATVNAPHTAAARTEFTRASTARAFSGSACESASSAMCRPLPVAFGLMALRFLARAVFPASWAPGRGGGET